MMWRNIFLFSFLALSSVAWGLDTSTIPNGTTPKEQMLYELDNLQKQLEDLNQLNSEQGKSLILLEAQSKDLNNLLTSTSLENKVLKMALLVVTGIAVTEFISIILN